MKTKTIFMLFMLLQIAVSAQTVIHYEYDANGNRYKRWMPPPQPVALPQNNSTSNNPTVAEDIYSLLTADSIYNAEEAITNTNSITVLTEGDIKVFPNPMQQKLNLQFKGTATPEGCSLQLYEGSGKLFYSEGSMKTLTEINMQQAKTGVYFLVVVDKEGKRLYWKLVKE
ncbi:MAG: T9SS type A sorting domain-containing protein [Bacteroidales bacterium]